VGVAVAAAAGMSGFLENSASGKPTGKSHVAGPRVENLPQSPNSKLPLSAGVLAS
jgi:hypothetical protein